MEKDRPYTYRPPQGALEIIHQDDDILVLSKPSGLLSVPGKTLDLHDSIQTRAKDIHRHATIVHRLDRGTSGVMVLALNRNAHRHLSRQFELRETQKTYIADVWGIVAEESGHIDLPLICDWPNRPRQKVDFENGKPAQTDWEVIARAEHSTRLRFFPKTGRSHQLRVHSLHLGHPILGDDFYACDDAYAASDRLALHAETLTLTHPVHANVISFTSTCPF